MKKIVVLMVLAAALCGASVNAQRPVGDTINIGEGDYLYYHLYANGAYAQFYGTSSRPELIYSSYWSWQLWTPLRGQMNFEEFIQEYPDMACDFAGRRIVGQEFPQRTESVMVIGLALCPTICTNVNTILALPSLAPSLHVVDTAVANRETEYVQLYTIDGDQPEFRAEGAWRIEDPHRYMMFPRYVSPESSPTYVIPINDTQYVALYEAMFDTGVLIEGGKAYMVAGTHNNNSTMWSSTAIDTVFAEPHICWQHYPITYSNTYCGYSGTWWCRRDTTWPWVSYSGGTGRATNIFPILDTLFGTPCASVTGLQTVSTDSLSATLMWSADARQHDWRVWYRPTDDTLGSGSVVTVATPTVTLSGLTPGTEYSVAVRGRCDIDNYSPWSDTLRFTTPRDTTQVVDTTSVDTAATQGIGRVGNLDLYTRIMPNPAGEVVNVLSSYRLESVAVYDLAGRLMLVQDAEGISAVVNVSTLAQGTYIMAIRTLQGVATKRLVVK